MYQLETIGKTNFFLKAIGHFPPPEAERFIREFEERTKSLSEFSVIIDITDASHLDGRSINLILNLLKQNNPKLKKSAYVISNNPPLDAEFKYLIEKAKSPKRKIVNTLKEAKEWLGINEIIIE